MIPAADPAVRASRATSPGAGRWVLVSGDFTPLGGMDRANHALASYLARRPGSEVHLVTHRAWPDLEAEPSVRVHPVPRPWGKHLLGVPLLARAGRRWAGALPGSRVVVNGGNCRGADANWVHYVHAAWPPHGGSPATPRGLKAAMMHRHHAGSERAAIRGARVVVANSDRTRDDIIALIGCEPGRVRTIYYGVDAGQFRPPSPEARAAARARLGWPSERPVVAFVGALGDARKGFDTLFAAWRILARDPGWDARLAVLGAGSTLPGWRSRADSAGLAGSIEFLGFRPDVPAVLAACDALASPARYEAYGLNVHEALCCGLPALVTASAGVAERYPASLSGLLAPDPDDPADWARRLRDWRSSMDTLRAAVEPFGRSLRARTWDDCAADVVAAVADAPPGGGR